MRPETGCLRLLQVSPFHPDEAHMGGPINLVRKIAAASTAGFTSIGVVAPARIAAPGDLAPASNRPDFRVIECDRILRYRTVSITALRPLDSALPDCDLVLIHGYRHWLPLWAAELCNLHGIPYLLHMHGMANRQFRSFSKKWIFDALAGPRMAYRAAAVICSSRSELEVARGILPHLRDTVVIPHGIPGCGPQPRARDCELWRERLALAPGQKLLVTLGRISRSKNYEATIRAAASLSTGTVLVLAGPVEDASYWRELNQLGESLGISSRLRFIPGVYGSEKCSLLRAGDAFVTTSRLDSFSMVVAEAAGQGTPVVYPNWIGIAEYLDTAGCYPVASLGPAVLAHAIEAAFRGPRIDLAELSTLDWGRILDRYAELFWSVKNGIPTGQSDLCAPGGPVDRCAPLRGC